MEMRACEETGMSQDLTPPISAIAASLHDPFLRSHCSSCFRSINQQPELNLSPYNPTSCAACHRSILYCSPRCSDADSRRHVSSGECRVLRSLLLPGQSTCRPGDTADLRAALRLLHSLDRLGLLPSGTDLLPPPRRLGGLLAGGLEDVLGGGGEMADRIRVEGRLMSRARGSDWGRQDRGGVSLEETALLVVLTNAVEVQVRDEGALGIAVYGPRFSWFNHSCSPNSCFRFELSSRPEPPLGSSDLGHLRVLPAGTDEMAAAVCEEWSRAESKLNQDVCHYGPKVVVRSIKTIKKGEEVCITYTDLLKPKAARHLDLWLKYQFVCCCERCDASPQMCLDYILNCNARNSNSDQSNKVNPDCEELSECLDQAIASYTSDGNPEAFCEKLEHILSENFQYKEFDVEEPPRRKLKMLPLHHLSLDSYIALASSYRIRAANFLSTGSGEEKLSEAFKMQRAAAAYSLLLAGATHHLLLSESSLVACVALFCTSAGESILDLARSSMRGSANTTNGSEFRLVSDDSHWNIGEGSSVSWDEFKAASMRFLECLSSNLLKSWPFLVQGFPYLESIRSPVNFSWLGIATMTPQILSCGLRATDSGEQTCFECSHTARICNEGDTQRLVQLAVHCLLYGRYLATICYGSRCYLAEHAKNLLHCVS